MPGNVSNYLGGSNCGLFLHELSEILRRFETSEFALLVLNFSFSQALLSLAFNVCLVFSFEK